MELRQIKTFMITAKLLSFTKAADQLGYAQSTVTGQIQGLEEELGTQLFERMPRQIKLTAYGEQLCHYAERIVTLTDEVKDSLGNSGSPRGSIVIGTPESLCAYRLPAVFNAFRSLYPHVELNLRFDVCEQDQTYLRKNEVDLAFRLDVPCRDKDIVSHVLFDEPLAVIAAPKHPLAQKKGVTPLDMHGQALILTEKSCSYRRLFEGAVAQAGAKPSSVLGVSSNEVIKRFVCDGWGIGFLPEIVISQEVASGQLVVLPWDGPALQVKAQLLYHKEKWISPALKAFIDMVLKELMSLPV